MIESIADLKLEFQTKRDIEARLLKKVCELTIVYYRIDNPEECYRHNISQLQNVTGKEHERK